MNTNFKSSEVLILLAASVMSFIANLPENLLGNTIDRKVLLAALTAMVVVAMFRYLQMLLLLTICVLAIGANLPAELASELGISQFALLVSLGALVAISLLNRVVKVLPTETLMPDTEIADSRQELLTVIAKGDMASLYRLLALNININFTKNGTTPLHLAAERGYPDIVRILIGRGADYRVKNAQGKTPLEIALVKKNFVQTTEILFNASKLNIAIPSLEETRRGDADEWRNQHN